jgi:glycosyltransferase involved in cell wall biosynthesis
MTNPPLQLSVITPTFQRPALLALCLRQFQAQSVGDLTCEQIVVSDGPDPAARFLVEQAGARYLELPAPRGRQGAWARDYALGHARGEYVCFWDDDNLYEPHALAALYCAASGVDLGIVRALYRFRKSVGMTALPRFWTGSFRFGDVDTMCVCVRRELALTQPWAVETDEASTEYLWLTRLAARNPTMRYVPITIGVHL